MTNNFTLIALSISLLFPTAAYASDDCIFIVDRDKRYLCQGDCTFIVDRDIRNLCKELNAKNQQQTSRNVDRREQDSTKRVPKRLNEYAYPKMEPEQGSDDSDDDHYFPSDNEQIVSKRTQKNRR